MWSSTFITELSKPVLTPVWLVSTARFGTGLSEPYGGDYSISNYPGYADEAIIGEGGVVVRGPRLAVASWTSSIGQFSIPIAGSIKGVLRHFTRGSSVVVRMGFPGWAVSDFEIIAVGRLQNVTGRSESWVMTCNDMLSMLESRFESSAASLPLFYDVGTSTTLTSAYTLGDATVNVTSTTGFSKQTGNNGAIKIGDFYLTYTGTTGTTFTGCSAAGQFGTTAATTASGAVTESVLLSGHPIDITRRLLVSTGLGTNGSYDQYPISWGLGFSQLYVDETDMQTWASQVVTVSSGAYQWDVVEDGQVDGPGGWWQAYLARAGLFLTIRQGLITCRAGQAHVGTSAQPYMPDIEITDADLIAISIQHFDASASVEYAAVTAQTATGSTTASDAIQTLPAEAVRLYDLAAVVFGNESAQRNDVTGRLTEMSCRIPMAIFAKCRGVRLAELTPGDVVPLTTTRVYGRTADTIDGFEARRCYVAQASMDWQRFEVSLILLAYPTDTEVFAP